ncbi:hypothetical protein NKR19_g6091 [Coniochaeta hoffmannii]|uniref:Protein kinase domain-containing protein n=1 Tax=Coniochaeta hoffmannii TaxID=91930 RepID=A0AA38RGD5_9PEZI|nr:hypothetical protein NKR19_g6091 [Coniochaeta hoffmannii]
MNEDLGEAGGKSEADEGEEDDEDEDNGDDARVPGEAMEGIGKGKERAQQPLTSVGDGLLPELKGECGDDGAKVRFIRHNGVVCFETRGGKLAEMREKDWGWTEYKGRQMLVYRVGKTVYITDDLHGAEITWLDYLGHGIAGIVFKVTVGVEPLDTGRVPRFWRARRPKARPRPNGDGFIQDEWPFEDECHNVALLEKLKWLNHHHGRRRRGPAAPHPATAPKTPHDNAANLRGFNDEARDSPLPAPPLHSDDPIPMPPVPALAECYGRTIVRRDATPRVRPAVSDYVDADADWHWALVYELVPGAPQDLAVGQAASGFLLRPWGLPWRRTSRTTGAAAVG